MKIIRRIIIWFIVIGVLGFFGIEGVVYFKGKQIVERELSLRLKRKVQVGSVHWVMPSGIVLNRVTIDGVGQAEKVKAVFVLSSLWQKPLMVTDFIIENPICIVPMRGRIMHFSGSVIRGSGWVDWEAKNIDVQGVMKDLSGKDVLVVGLKGEDNDIAVLGSINMASFMAQGMRGQKVETSVRNTIAGVLGSLNTDTMTKFSFKTKLDTFSLENISFSGKFIVN